MDWERVKKASADFDAIINKQINPADACEDANIMLAALMYCDAKWIAEAPKANRKAMLEKVYKPFQDDVKDMVKMIVNGQI